jgi:hypothetical protein
LIIAEAERFPELGKALSGGGPGRAIAAPAVAFADWAKLGLLRATDAQVAASNFNWLIMGEPVNRVMLLGDDVVPSAALLPPARTNGRVCRATTRPACRLTENWELAGAAIRCEHRAARSPRAKPVDALLEVIETQLARLPQPARA